MSAAVVDVDITRLISANARASVMKYILVERRKIQLESNWEISGTKNGSLQGKMGLRAQDYLASNLWVDSFTFPYFLQNPISKSDIKSNI